MQIAPLPTDLDTNVWKPLTTLPAEPVPTAASLSPQPTPTETPEQIFEILPFPVPSDAAELKKRQGVSAAVPPVVTQVSPITTYQIDLVRNGVATRLNVVYTQTFNPIPDQWPSPTEAGTIGLGTIVGEIGVVKTKRSLPTQAPLADSPDPSPTVKSPDNEDIPLLEKLRKAGKEIQEEVEDLLNKVKKPSFEGNTLMDKLRKAGKEIQGEVEELLNKVKKPASENDEESSLPLRKELKVSTSGSATSKIPVPFGTPSGSPSKNEDPFNFGGSEEAPSDPFNFEDGGNHFHFEEGSEHTDAPFHFDDDSKEGGEPFHFEDPSEPFHFESPSEPFHFESPSEPFHFESPSEPLGESNLLPEKRIHENDARVLKAGSLAIIAVTIGTLCVNYL